MACSRCALRSHHQQLLVDTRAGLPRNAFAPFKEFPSPIAVPHHCSRYLLVVFTDPIRQSAVWYRFMLPRPKPQHVAIWDLQLAVRSCECTLEPSTKTPSCFPPVGTEVLRAPHFRAALKLNWRTNLAPRGPNINAVPAKTSLPLVSQHHTQYLKCCHLSYRLQS